MTIYPGRIPSTAGLAAISAADRLALNDLGRSFIAIRLIGVWQAFGRPEGNWTRVH